MGAEARPAVRVQVGIAVNHEQGHAGQTIQRRAQRRELAQVELARPVGLNIRHQFNAVSHQPGEAGIGCYDGRRPGAAGRQVVNVRSHENVSVRAAASLHLPSMPGPPEPGTSGAMCRRGQIWRSRPAQYGSRSVCFSTLPLGVRGNASMMSTVPGHL